MLLAKTALVIPVSEWVATPLLGMLTSIAISRALRTGLNGFGSGRKIPASLLMLKSVASRRNRRRNPSRKGRVSCSSLGELKTMKFRTLFIFLTSFVLAAAFGRPASGQSASELGKKLELLKAYPDLILINADIHTMDAKLSRVQAMAVRDHRILMLGTYDEVRFLAGPKTEVVDAKGRVVIP